MKRVYIKYQYVMIKVLIAVVLALVIIFSLNRYLRRWKDVEARSRKPMILDENTSSEESSNMGTCQKCGEERVIVNEGMCAYCWSTSITSGLK